MAEYKLIFVNRVPFRVWSGASPYRDQDLIQGLRPGLHLRLAKDLVDSLDQEDNDHAVLGLRLLYGLSLETFFALLFATLQAPEAPSAWLLLYRENDLQELIERFQAGEDLPSRLVCSEPGSWETLAVMLFPSSLMEDETRRGRAKRLGALWAEWASEYLDKDMKAEFNSLKHGLRIRSAAPYLALGGHVIESDEHGSWFATCQKSKSDILLGVCARSWSGRALYSRLKLITISSMNLVEVLKLLHRVGDTDRFTCELPDDDELDAAKPSSKPLAGLRLGPSWEENRHSSRLSYEEAIGEYKTLSGTFKIEGKLP